MYKMFGNNHFDATLIEVAVVDNYHVHLVYPNKMIRLKQIIIILDIISYQD